MLALSITRKRNGTYSLGVTLAGLCGRCKMRCQLELVNLPRESVNRNLQHEVPRASEHYSGLHRRAVGFNSCKRTYLEAFDVFTIFSRRNLTEILRKHASS